MQEAFPENPSRPQARKTTGLHELDPNVVATLPYWAPPLDYTGPVRETKKTVSSVASPTPSLTSMRLYCAMAWALFSTLKFSDWW
jgi:hypothetical protein